MSNEEFLKHIMPEIEEYLIKNNSPFFIQAGYEWFRDVVTLYAKQHNLLEAAITLMDSGMNEEAYIIARSAINNYFLIGYLLNDNKDRTRLKEYHTQPLISKKYQLENIKEMIKGSFGKRMKLKGVTLPYTMKDLNARIKEIESSIIKEGFSKDKKPLSVLKLANKSDSQGFDMYASYYSEASKFEHSDITSLNIYKRAINNDISINQAFIMDLNRTDENLKKIIYSIFIITYLDSCSKICDVIANKEPHLKVNYNISKIEEILMKSVFHINNS